MPLRLLHEIMPTCFQQQDLLRINIMKTKNHGYIIITKIATMQKFEINLDHRASQLNSPL